MSYGNGSQPRLSVELSEAQDKALRELIPRNMKSPVIRAMVDTLIHLLRSLPAARLNILTLIVANEFDLAKATFQEALEKEEHKNAQQKQTGSA